MVSVRFPFILIGDVASSRVFISLPLFKMMLLNALEEVPLIAAEFDPLKFIVDDVVKLKMPLFVQSPEKLCMRPLPAANVAPADIVRLPFTVKPAVAVLFVFVVPDNRDRMR